MSAPEPPLAILLELTHRCPLQCPYCYNPLALVAPDEELATDEWRRVMAEAKALGALQVHFSGGEPAARSDLEDLVRDAARLGLYSNLITSGVSINAERLKRLAAAGIDHVQLSLQDVNPANSDRIAGLKGAHEKKRAFARAVTAEGLALTLNAIIHRQNEGSAEGFIALALELGAGRLELAHVQYYGWGLANRAALMPAREDVIRTADIVAKARERLKGRLVIDHVIPDYYAERPKACMGGWARRFIVIDPKGDALPCHAAKTLPLAFDNVRDMSLKEIWTQSPAFNHFRGTAWMPEPCRSCDQREVDWGGCRCQALALAGDAGATDPACALAPQHERIAALAATEAAGPAPAFRYRRFGG